MCPKNLRKQVYCSSDEKYSSETTWLSLFYFCRSLRHSSTVTVFPFLTLPFSSYSCPSLLVTRSFWSPLFSSLYLKYVVSSWSFGLPCSLTPSSLYPSVLNVFVSFQNFLSRLLFLRSVTFRYIEGINSLTWSFICTFKELNVKGVYVV